MEISSSKGGTKNVFELKVEIEAEGRNESKLRKFGGHPD
jgi:hypothetical protein